MSRHGNLENSRIQSPRILSATHDILRFVLTGTFVIPPDAPTMHFLDPGAADRTVFLPVITPQAGQVYFIANLSTTKLLNIVDSGGVAVGAVAPGLVLLLVSYTGGWKVSIVNTASTLIAGIVRLATNTEARAFSDATIAISPSNLGSVLALDTQTFTTVGANTWTKPPQGRMALIQWIGAAGGGARRSSGNGAGGGSGAYFERLYPLSSFGATEIVTIGAGGAIQLTDNTDGNNGGNTSFGAFQTIYGGRGGAQAAAGVAATGGGSATFLDIWALGVANNIGFISGQQGAIVTTAGVLNQALYGTHSTGATAANAVQTIALQAFQGGGGGAGHSTTGPVSGVPSTSQNGGNGGAGNGAGAGGNGASPGGGGGSGTTQGGFGGDGRVIATVF